MIKPLQLSAPLMLCLLAFTHPSFSQDDKNPQAMDNTAGANESGESPVASGQEVEVNEDMYRRFMELKDARQQRMILPEDAFKPGSGSQKLDKLPEESQKHLRNQLREIILQGNSWQPGDENTNYPYVPSQAALANSELQKQEAEAWGELLDSYHKREAQIYENSARTKAAMATQNDQSGNSGQSSSQSQGSSQNQGSSSSSGGQASSAEQSTQQARAEQAETDQSEIPNSARITSSSSSAGVSQNAMEFLQRMQKQAGQNDAAQSDQAMAPTLADSQPGSGPGGPETQPNDITEQSESSEKSSNSPAANNGSDKPNAENLAGVSQNALEFLQQDGQEGEKNANINKDSTKGTSDGDEQLADSGELSDSTQSTEAAANADGEAETFADQAEPGRTETGNISGATQNALEYVIGEQSVQNDGQRPDPAATGSTSGTLSISDLVNARGVGTGTKPAPPPPVLKEETPPVEIPPVKDGDG